MWQELAEVRRHNLFAVAMPIEECLRANTSVRYWGLRGGGLSVAVQISDSRQNR